ncbi:MAG: bacillithiol biosynthesis deacetylase BshB1 [Melioribacteraceae bacterium]|nr:bacillithiol biosynthesis deacetylase BshB1 [Melioribacteraceae bacterium]
MKLDVIVFAAHPDDAEIGMGGTIALLTDNGFRVGIIDLTKAELSTRGDVKTRSAETVRASQILGLELRENLELSDGHLEVTDEYIKMIVRIIRNYKPEIIFAPYFNDRHPDHIAVSQIVKKAYFLSGLKNFDTGNSGGKTEAVRPKKIFYYMQSFKFDPKFIVDITKYFETKMNSVKAYKTQFFDPENTEPNTFISDPKFINYLEARSKFYGFQIGREYGEPFFSEEEVELDIINLLKRN